MDIKKAAEKQLGIVISNDEFQDALRRAQDKLNRINERYGTSHSDEYLAVLVAEQVQFAKFSDFCNAMHRVRAEQKKRPAQSAPVHHHHHSTTHGIKCQEVF